MPKISVVVASKVGGIPEVVESGFTGFLHEPDDVDGMAASVTRLLADRPLWTRLSKAAGEETSSPVSRLL